MLVPSTLIPLALTVLAVAQLRAHEWEWAYWVITASIDAEAKDLAAATADITVKVERCGYIPINDLRPTLLSSSRPTPSLSGPSTHRLRLNSQQSELSPAFRTLTSS